MSPPEMPPAWLPGAYRRLPSPRRFAKVIILAEIARWSLKHQRIGIQRDSKCPFGREPHENTSHGIRFKPLRMALLAERPCQLLKKYHHFIGCQPCQLLGPIPNGLRVPKARLAVAQNGGDAAITPKDRTSRLDDGASVTSLTCVESNLRSSHNNWARTRVPLRPIGARPRHAPVVGGLLPVLIGHWAGPRASYRGAASTQLAPHGNSTLLRTEGYSAGCCSCSAVAIARSTAPSLTIRRDCAAHRMGRRAGEASGGGLC